MNRLGIVVQRYGGQVIGGAETLAREVAERLSRRGCDVRVYTTTAQDYLSWKNHYPPGETILRGVLIKRFWVEGERDIEDFNRFSQVFFGPAAEERDESEWIRRQGPFCPDLVAALRQDEKELDALLFFTYLYYPTVEGMPAVSKPALLFPTAHDEPPLYLRRMRDAFARANALCFLTQAEMDLVARVFRPAAPMILVRSGIDIHPSADEAIFRRQHLVFKPYLLYAGRIEKGKGLELVFDAFRRIRGQRPLELILIGKQLMPIPEEPGIRYLGYVSEAEKAAAFRGALLSVQPSALESLSITTLESFAQRTPVLVNRQSAVLREHMEISQGGRGYGSVEEFVAAVLEMYDKPTLRRKMGDAGHAYIRQYYSWDTVTERILEAVAAAISVQH